MLPIARVIYILQGSVLEICRGEVLQVPAKTDYLSWDQFGGGVHVRIASCG